MSAPREPDEADAVGLEEEFADVFDCGALDVSCHITKWFHGLVVGILEPLFGWIAGKLFMTPEPTDSVTSMWQGLSATANTLYILLIIAAGFVIMAHHSLQNQYAAKEILPRLVVGFVASNVSLSVVGLAAEASTAISQAITADGINSDTAARNLTQRTTIFLGEQGSIIVLFLLGFVVLLVLWVIVEIVRIVIVILLMVGGPLMLVFHALPQTNRIAQMWWRALAAVCLVPIVQAVAFVALMRLFFEGDTQVLFGVAHIMRGEVDLFDLFLLLVLVYVQLRIPIWAYKAVWSSPTGRSPVTRAAKALTWAVVLATASAATGGGAAAGAAAGGRGGRAGALVRAGHRGIRRARAAQSTTHTAALPRRARTWRFSTPATRHTKTSPVNPQPMGTDGPTATRPAHPSTPEPRTYGRSAPTAAPRHTPVPPVDRPPGAHRRTTAPGHRHPHTEPDHKPRTHDPRSRAEHRPHTAAPRHGAPAHPAAPPRPSAGSRLQRFARRPVWHRTGRHHRPRPRPPWRWNRRRN